MDFERRLQGELRVAHLARWVYLALCLLGGIATQVLYVEHGSPLPVRVMTLACFLFDIALSFTAPWWFGRIARRRRAEIDGWRRWMDEQNLQSEKDLAHTPRPSPRPLRYQSNSAQFFPGG